MDDNETIRIDYMTTEQNDRLLKIEDNIDNLKEDIGNFYGAITKANGDIEKLDATLSGKVDNMHATLNGKVDNLYATLNGKVDNMHATLNGKVDNLDTLMNGKLGIFDQRFSRLEEKLDQIVRNTSRKEDKKTRLYIAVAAAVIGGALGALSRLLG